MISALSRSPVGGRLKDGRGDAVKARCWLSQIQMLTNNMPAFCAAAAGKKMPSSGSRRALGKKVKYENTTRINCRHQPQE